MSDSEMKNLPKKKQNTAHSKQDVKSPFDDHNINEEAEHTAIMAARMALSMYQGPVPRADELAKYNQIEAGMANRLVTMAENEQKHNHQMEQTYASNIMKVTIRAQVFAFIVAMIGMGSATFLTMMGHPTVGGITGGTSLIILVLAFLGKELNWNSFFGEKNKD